MSETVLPRTVTVRDLRQGHVITSPRFSYGLRRDGFTWVDGVTESRPVETRRYSADERLRIAAESGKIPPEAEYDDEAAFDPGRGAARFIVTAVSVREEFVEDEHADGFMRWLCSGSSSGKCGSYVQHLQFVEARRLHEDGSLGECIRFDDHLDKLGGDITLISVKKPQTIYVD